MYFFVLKSSTQKLNLNWRDYLVANETEKEWTIMVYMAGDNNLSIDMVYALEQLKNAADQNNNINLLVYFDGNSSNIPTLYCDFTDCSSTNYSYSYYIKDKLIKRKTGLNENSASVNNVINFVDWCVNKVEYKKNGKSFNGRKAKNYAMIFSGHSFGFQNEGLFKDEKANYSMNLSKLKWMFERITFPNVELKKLANSAQARDKKNWNKDKFKERTTEIIGKPLSILGFDSCVMSMLEIGCQFKNISETMVASEGSIPNAGWSYAQILLDKIGNNKESTAKEIAASFVENFILQQNKYALAEISVDMTAWDLKELDKLEKAFAKFVKKLTECFDDSNSTVFKQMKRIMIQVHWQCQTYMYQQNIDLGDFCYLLNQEIESLKTEFDPSQIQPIIELEILSKDVLDNIKKCVILTGFSGGKYQFSNGISLFFPWSWTSYCASKQSYEALNFVKNSNAGELWNKFLQKYLREISLRKAKPLSSINTDGTFNVNQDGSIVYKSFIYENEMPDSGELVSSSNIKIPEEGTFKIPEEGTFKIPEEGTFKLIGTVGTFFNKFLETKNIETHWDRSGFIPNQVNFFLDGLGKDKNNKKEINIANKLTMEFLPCNDKIYDVQADKNSTIEISRPIKDKKARKKQPKKK